MSMLDVRMCAATVAITCAWLLGLSGAYAADPYRISVILPLTGGAAFLGKGEQEALQLLENVTNKEGDINAQPLQFVFHDDQSNPQITVQIANGIMAEKPAVMLGSGNGGMCKRSATLLTRGLFQF